MIGNTFLGETPIGIVPSQGTTPVYVNPQDLAVALSLEQTSLSVAYSVVPVDMNIATLLDTTHVIIISGRTWGPALQGG